MLRTEKCDQLHAGSLGEYLDGRAGLRIKARVIGDQADVFPAQRSEFPCFQHVQPGLHAVRAASVFFLVGACWDTRSTCKQSDIHSNEGQFVCATVAKWPQTFLPLCIINDILERFVWRRVVSMKCVCYIQAQAPVVSRENHIG